MRRNRWLSASLFALAAGLAITVLLGPLVTGVVHYRVSELMLSQLKGVDFVSLIVVAPLCVVTGLLAARGHRAAPALALGPAIYVLYVVTETIVGPNYLRVPGNNERLFPLLIALFILAGTIVLIAWNQLEPSNVGASWRRSDRIAGAFFIALGAFLVIGRYLPGLADAMSSRPTGTDYLAGPTIYWTIALEDLGIVIPAMIAVGIGMWRGRPWVARARFAIAGWGALIPLTVVSMSATMYVDKQPSASWSSIALMSVMAVAFILPAALCFGPLFRTGRTEDPVHAGVKISVGG